MMWGKVKLHNLIEKPISGEWGTGEGSVKVIRSTNFTNDGTLDLTDVVIRDVPFSKVEKKKLRNGDIIIEKSGGSPTQPVGRVVHFLLENEEYLCNNFTSVLRPKATVNPRYLFWCLFSGHVNGSTLKYQNKTTGIINLQLERYCNEFEVPLPPLHIQEHIADTLDKADALCRKDQEMLQKYDELAQSIFYDMFGDPVRNDKGWQLHTLEDISEGKGQYGSGASAIEYDPQKYRYVRITDITERGKLNERPVSASENNDDYLLHDGDLLFARTGATVGKTYMYHRDDGPCIYAGYLIRFKINKVIALPEYVFYFCKTEYYRNWVASKQNVVAQPNINAQQYGKELLIPIPPVPFQQKFLSRLKSCNAASEICSESIRYTEGVFHTLLQSNFS
jgi:type I restriction enzyme S subunit